MLIFDNTPSHFDGLNGSSAFYRNIFFQRKIDQLLDIDEYEKFQTFLSLDPTVGSLIPGTAGCRKVRWALAGKGKRGGIRVIYYYLTNKNEIYLLQVYQKNEKDNLTHNEKNELRKIIGIIEAES